MRSLARDFHKHLVMVIKKHVRNRIIEKSRSYMDFKEVNDLFKITTQLMLQPFLILVYNPCNTPHLFWISDLDFCCTEESCQS